MDKSGSDFSIELYKNLFSGKTFGESVRIARKKLIETGSDVHFQCLAAILFH
jgi:hypothetical protein